MSNKGPTRSEAVAAPRRKNNLKAAQQRLLLRQLEERRDELSENISKLSIADEEVSRPLAKADEAAKRAVAIQGSVHPDNDGSHLR